MRGPGAWPWPAARGPDLGFPQNGAGGSGGSTLRGRVVGVWGSGLGVGNMEKARRGGRGGIRGWTWSSVDR